MIETLVASLLSLVVPGLGQQWVSLLSALIVGTVELVDELRDANDLDGAAKHRAAVEAVGRLVDNALDPLPEWRELDEAQRDRILGGLVELAYLLVRAQGSHGGALRKVRRALRRR